MKPILKPLKQDVEDFNSIANMPDRLDKASRGLWKKGQQTIGKEMRQQKFLDLFPSHDFNVTQTAKDAGIDRRTFYLWLNNDPDFRDRFEDLKDSRIDAIESKLYEKALAGDTISILFFLKCQGKKRGWIEQPNKQFLEISEGPRFDQQQIDAVVRGANIDRPKYEAMLDIGEPDI